MAMAGLRNGCGADGGIERPTRPGPRRRERRGGTELGSAAAVEEREAAGSGVGVGGAGASGPRKRVEK